MPQPPRNHVRSLQAYPELVEGNWRRVATHYDRCLTTVAERFELFGGADNVLHANVLLGTGGAFLVDTYDVLRTGFLVGLDAKLL